MANQTKRPIVFLLVTLIHLTLHREAARQRRKMPPSSWFQTHRQYRSKSKHLRPQSWPVFNTAVVIDSMTTTHGTFQNSAICERLRLSPSRSMPYLLYETCEELLQGRLLYQDLMLMIYCFIWIFCYYICRHLLIDSVSLAQRPS